MKYKRCGQGPRGFSLGGFLIKGLLVMLLWNAIVPALFAGPAIGFLQSVGLMILGRLLTGGMRKGFARGGGHDKMRQHWKNKMREKWSEMSQEDKTSFRDSFRKGPVEVNVFDVDVEEEEEDK
ncbi:MAG: hypothetical protein AB8H47_06150 [Bacteroidia bacterium]